MPPGLALYERMHANLLASFERYASASASAFVERLLDVAVAVFPAQPERAVYNNAILSRDLDRGRADTAIRIIEDAYASAAVDRFAVWAHESEADAIAALEGRGYHVDTTTRAMAMSLDAITVSRPQPRLASAGWQQYLTVLSALGAPEGLLVNMDPRGYHAAVACLDGVEVAAAIAFDHDGDCGIYNVGTQPHARRRGLAGALTAQLLHDARERGCTTASLQATPMAEHLYADVGFQDLGRFIEYMR